DAASTMLASLARVAQSRTLPPCPAQVGPIEVALAKLREGEVRVVEPDGIQIQLLQVQRREIDAAQIGMDVGLALAPGVPVALVCRSANPPREPIEMSAHATKVPLRAREGWAGARHVSKVIQHSGEEPSPRVSQPCVDRRRREPFRRLQRPADQPGLPRRQIQAWEDFVSIDTLFGELPEQA